MNDPVSAVTEFLALADRGMDDFANAVRGWFTPQTIWENVGMGTTVGPDEASALIGKMKAGGIAAMRIENLAFAAAGHKVLNERIDYMVNADGEVLRTVRAMGIFEIDEDGKIAQWRDYFDTAAFR